MIEELPCAMLANGPGVHKGGRPFERLHQVGHDRVLHQDGHRARDSQILRRNRLAARARADDDAAEPFAHIGQTGRQRENRHHFAGDGNVKAGDALVAFLIIAQVDLNLAEVAVVDVHNPLPRDAFRIDVEPEETAHVLRIQVGEVIGFDA